MGLGMLRFFFDTENRSGGVKLYHAIALRIMHRIAEYAGPALKFRHDTIQVHLAVKDVVPQDQAYRLIIDELLADQEGLGDALRFGLDLVGQLDAPAGAIAQQRLKTGRIMGGGDQEDIADAGCHQGRQRIVDHRLVVDRLQLFAGDQRQRVEPAAGAAGQNYTFAYRLCHGCDYSFSD